MTTRPTLKNPELSPIARRMMKALITHGAMDAQAWSVQACASIETVKAYIVTLLKLRRIHVSATTRNKNNQPLRVYAYGPGNGVEPKLSPEIYNDQPMFAMPIPRPDALTAALMHL